MASTRDINNINNYNLEQKDLKKYVNHNLYLNSSSGKAYYSAFPLLYNNGKLPGDILSCNHIDIESNLRGIGANNLVNPKEKTEVKLKSLPDISFFTRPELITSKNFYGDSSQRPFIY